MRMVDLIAKKRDGYPLSREEIDFIVQGYTNDDIPDYQIAALAMAIYFQGMTDEECADLTLAMAKSGEEMDLSSIAGIKVDKHSTGGVGDKTTIALAPLVASLGVPVAKMSGRGLGHTGGTLDKLESIPGFCVEVTTDQFIRLVNTNKLAVIGQSKNLTPADKKLYALRDVTATVNSIPLIASSIMSKKIAAGADAIVLDVKVGSGAFMKELTDAKKLAETMVAIGNNLGRKTMAVISDMNQPLGRAIGNALEVKEAIEFLRGEGPADLQELCYTLGSYMVVLAKRAATVEEAREKLSESIKSGNALETFKSFVRAQGGDARVAEDFSLLPHASETVDVKAEKDGFVFAIDAEKVGLAAMRLGAGRETKDASIDLSVGIVLHKKIADRIERGDVIATIHTNSKDVSAIVELIKAAYTIASEKVEKPNFIYDIIE